MGSSGYPWHSSLLFASIFGAAATSVGASTTGAHAATTSQGAGGAVTTVEDASRGAGTTTTRADGDAGSGRAGTTTILVLAVAGSRASTDDAADDVDDDIVGRIFFILCMIAAVFAVLILCAAAILAAVRFGVLSFAVSPQVNVSRRSAVNPEKKAPASEHQCFPEHWGKNENFADGIEEAPIGEIRLSRRSTESRGPGRGPGRSTASHRGPGMNALTGSMPADGQEALQKESQATHDEDLDELVNQGPTRTDSCSDGLTSEPTTDGQPTFDGAGAGNWGIGGSARALRPPVPPINLDGVSLTSDPRSFKAQTKPGTAPWTPWKAGSPRGFHSAPGTADAARPEWFFEATCFQDAGKGVW